MKKKTKVGQKLLSKGIARFGLIEQANKVNDYKGKRSYYQQKFEESVKAGKVSTEDISAYFLTRINVHPNLQYILSPIQFIVLKERIRLIEKQAERSCGNMVKGIIKYSNKPGQKYGKKYWTKHLIDDLVDSLNYAVILQNELGIK